MKRLLILLMAALTAFSCEKQEGSDNPLVGKWQLIKIETEQVAHSGTSRLTNTVENTFYVFNNDGTVKYYCKDGSIKEYVYSLDMENMTLTIGSSTHQVKELTKKTLIFFDTGQFLDGTATPPAAGTIYSYSYLSKVD